MSETINYIKQRQKQLEDDLRRLVKKEAAEEAAQIAKQEEASARK